jgi:hypothetical protein
MTTTATDTPTPPDPEKPKAKRKKDAGEACAPFLDPVAHAMSILSEHFGCVVLLVRLSRGTTVMDLRALHGSEADIQAALLRAGSELCEHEAEEEDED